MKKMGIVAIICMMLAVGVIVGNCISRGKVASADSSDKEIVLDSRDEDKDTGDNGNEECSVCQDGDSEEDISESELLKRGYTEENLAFSCIVREIEAMKHGDMTEEEIIALIDEQAEEEEALANSGRGTIDELAKQAYATWQGLTIDEKKLIICHPKKALAVYAAAQKATEITIAVFGYNGLGDMSDGFRHVIWCAMMARDAGEKYAREYAKAHESGKTEEDLKKVAGDGFTEKEHLAMDEHNNEIGFTLGANSSYSNMELISLIEPLLTNNKATGIIWLH